MKRISVILLSAAFTISLSGAPAFAQRGGSAGRGGGNGGGNAGGASRGNSNPGSPPARGRGDTNNAGKNDNAGKSDAAGKPDKPATPPENKLARNIEQNPKLADKIKPLLPTGMTMDQASSGFKNQGQFIAALHTSKNLNIPFADLKAKLTGDNSMSLGKAIETLKPNLGKDKANEEVKKAEKQAKETEKS